MAVPHPNVLLALFIVSFSLSAIFHRSAAHLSPSPPSVFSRYAADILVISTNDTFASRPAAFGPTFESSMQGELVNAWGDGLACDAPVSPEDEFEFKIVLVKRGKCSFAEKVRRVQDLGGVAVIVGDNVAGSGLVTMYAKDDDDITIPSTFIPHTSYLSLLSLLALSPPSVLEIEIMPSTASDWPLLDTLLLVVLSPLFTLACIYILLILRRRVQRRRELAPVSVVRALPTRRWTREKDNEEENGESSTPIPQGYGSRTSHVHILECVICLEDFVEGDVVITLPCYHEFHQACITPWLTIRRRLCPICKRDIIAPAPGIVDERSPLLRTEQTHPEDPDWRGETAASV